MNIHLKTSDKVKAILILSILYSCLAIGQTKLSKIVISNGGQVMTGGNYRVNLTIGQSFADKVKQTNTQACVGFWYLAKEMSTATVEIERNSVIDPVSYLKIYPNPFHHKATAEFQVNTKGKVKLYWIDMQGNKITDLLDEILIPGQYRVSLKAEPLTSGMYTLVLLSDQQLLKQKCMVMN